MRIISGQYKGKKLIAASENITRPTSDRAKEGLFNVLESYLLKQGKNWMDISFVDVFAGSGAIGIEALSRGAKHCFFFEKNKEALLYLKQNLNCFQVDRYQILNDALLPPIGQKAIQIYFSDAPYHQNLSEKALNSFLQKGWINSETLIVIEADSNEDLKFPNNVEIIRKLSYGRNQFFLGRILQI
ncbi:MAG: 16S rRNA (guanine(966)-N(2))-methyltransferase RsmD [Alphaproteobacteria bacterium]|nr:16S rRNA (guanine(966)-N(2))-methyltransferase RsmD [Alphaproteobacteria bacterium]MBQ3117234.1 16S rRNA (guanine(966)-N(2))-methyltransferase RsmD [Alphaproteobacteria bacterium]MBR3913594.1 16S rRNA (guanine(966)-N(2))-methyltransferase RsmD [Alphaproteobacteria bacterium]